MNIHTQELFKRNLQFIFFLVMSILCIISIIANFWQIHRSSNPILIGIDNNGTRLIATVEDPIFKTETAVFIKSFLSKLYNFNSETFLRQMGSATNLMSESLWAEKKNSIVDLRNRISTDNIAITSKIEKITRDESGIYHGLLSIREKNRMSEKDHKIHVKLTVQKTTRTQENPFGMEINSYEETRLNN